MSKPSKRLQHISTLAAGIMLFVFSTCNQAAAATDAATDPAVKTTVKTTIGTDIDDTVLAANVRSKLLADEVINSLDIKVKVRKGEVMLSGFADSQFQIDRSVAVTQIIEGVRNIDNKLVIKQGKQSVGNKLDDSIITARVKSVLLSDATLKRQDISVTTRKGAVQLSGFVESDLQLEHALELARGIEGVTQTLSSMSVKK